QMLKRLVFTWPYVVGLQYMLLVVLGVTRYSWRYVGLREATRILIATGLFTLALSLVRLVAILTMPTFAYVQYAHVPGGVILIDALLAFLGVSSVRVLRRMQGERWASRGRATGVEALPTLLIGAGEAGVM